MAGIKDYSTTAASNNSAPPNGWPEGMAPSAVNNSARQNMADLRSWYEDAQWVNLGHTAAQASATTFTIGADVTSEYTAGRAIRIEDSSTLYRTIVSSSYSSPNTTVTVDSGTLTSSMNGQSVSLGVITPTNDAFPRTFIHEQAELASLTASDAVLFADSRSSGLANQHKKVLWSTLSKSVGSFRVYSSTSQTVPQLTVVKMQFDTVDTAVPGEGNAWFDTATNYRFQPQVAGFYWVHFQIVYQSNSVIEEVQARIDKNGVLTAEGRGIGNTSIGSPPHTGAVTNQFYMNGSSDYLEFNTVQFNTSGSNQSTNINSHNTYATGFLIGK